MSSTSPDSDGYSRRRPFFRRRRGACTNCKRYKVKCDGNTPCSSCEKASKDCEYRLRARQNARARLESTGSWQSVASTASNRSPGGARGQSRGSGETTSTSACLDGPSVKDLINGFMGDFKTSKAMCDDFLSLSPEHNMSDMGYVLSTLGSPPPRDLNEKFFAGSPVSVSEWLSTPELSPVDGQELSSIWDQELTHNSYDSNEDELLRECSGPLPAETSSPAPSGDHDRPTAAIGRGLMRGTGKHLECNHQDRDYSARIYNSMEIESLQGITGRKLDDDHGEGQRQFAQSCGDIHLFYQYHFALQSIYAKRHNDQVLRMTTDELSKASLRSAKDAIDVISQAELTKVPENSMLVDLVALSAQTIFSCIMEHVGSMCDLSYLGIACGIIGKLECAKAPSLLEAIVKMIHVAHLRKGSRDIV